MLKFATCWIAFRPKWATWLYLNVHAEVLPKCFPMVQLHVQLQDHYAATDLQIFNLTSKTHFFTCNATFKCSSSLPHLVFQRWNQDESCAKTLEVLPGCQQALGSGTGSSTQEPPFAIFFNTRSERKGRCKVVFVNWENDKLQLPHKCFVWLYLLSKFTQALFTKWLAIGFWLYFW